MRIFVLPVSAIALVGANEPPANQLDNPAYSTPPERWETLDDAVEDAREAGFVVPDGVRLGDPEDYECRDRIHDAREASGQPPLPELAPQGPEALPGTPLLDRQPASPDRPQAIYAVDRRQDGCSVMVMMGDPDDIRPLPLPADRFARMIPAEDAAQAENGR